VDLGQRAWPPRPRSAARGGRRPVLAALLVLLFGLGIGGTAAGASTPVGWSAAVGGPINGQVRLTLVSPDASAPALAPDSVDVTVDGVRQPSRIEPLLSDRLALGLVVDGSNAGRVGLPVGVSGATDLLLAARPAHSALVVDQSPPTVAAPLQPAPSATLAALSGISSVGERRTAEAFELAVRQLPATPTEPRLLVLYTAAPDAGGPPVAELVERLNAAGVVLAVVHATTEGEPASAYWSAAGAGTGGLALSAPPARVIAAFVQLQTNLRDRYLVTFPAPPRLPATALVRGDTPNGPFSVSVVLRAPAAAAPAGSAPPGDLGWKWPLMLSALVLAVVAIGLIASRAIPRLLARHSTRSPPGRHRRC
jgi:hypothetical protein